MITVYIQHKKTGKTFTLGQTKDYGEAYSLSRYAINRVSSKYRVIIAEPVTR